MSASSRGSPGRWSKRFAWRASSGVSRLSPAWALEAWRTCTALRCGTKLVSEGKVDPCLSHTYAYDDIPECHQLMLENKHPYGNMAVLVNARQPGQGATR